MLIGESTRHSLFMLVLSVVLVAPLAMAQEDPEPEYASNVVVVQFAPGTVVANKASVGGLQEFDRKASRYGVNLLERVYPFLDHVEPTPKTRRNLLALRRTYFVHYSSRAAPKQVAGDLAAAHGVVYAEPVLVNRTEVLNTGEVVDPNDPRFGDQPELQLMGLPAAWDVVKGENGSPRVVIAIVDGGGEWRHEDLRANVWTNSDEVAGNGIDDDNNGFVDDVHGVNFASGDHSDPTGLLETPGNALHGTTSAGSASAVTDNGVGVSGASWNAEIMHINSGCGGGGADIDICSGYQGILYAAANGADIINASWGGLAGTDDDVKFVDQTIDLATDMGALVVAAAGNESSNNDLTRDYPARSTRVLSVGATEKTTRRRAGFSNYGRSVNVFAPGVSILTTGVGNSYVSVSGTSLSSPLTAGLAALVKTRFPNMTPDALREHIRLTSDNMDTENPGMTGQLGRGFVNALAAVQAPSLPAVRLHRWSWTDNDGDLKIAPGDVVTVTATVINYLSDARQLRVGLSGDEQYSFIDLTAADFRVGRLASGDSAEVRFEFKVAADAPPNQQVYLYTRIQDGTFEDGADLLSFGVNKSLESVHPNLSAFYAATGGNNWTRNDNWDITRVPSEEELATWYGVQLREGFLVGLGLRENNLTGVLPPELGNLEQLESLNVRDNNLTGPIPIELASLPQLETLDLRYNTLTGPIPRELSNLMQMKQLILRGNSLTGPIPPEIGNLPQLRWLMLDVNSLSGPIPPELGSLPQVTELFLNHNSLTGPIPPELGSLPQVKILHLHNNPLTGSIPPELGGLPELRNLSLSGTDLSGPIPPELGNLPQLQYLDLSHTDLTGPIPPELGNLTQLKWLKIENTEHLTGPIPPELGNLAQLERLLLSPNTLTGPIPPELGNLEQLEWLWLREIDLTGPIPPEIGNLARVEWLDLRGNTLTGPIPPELGDLAQVQQLDLSQNNLTGPIPPEFGNLTKLRELLLFENSLTGPIPPEFGNLTKLRYLDLFENSLTGPIPPELGTLTQLDRLDLRDNSLTGSIPPELGRLPQLKFLDLRSNSLTGPIPPELGSFPQLETLDLRHNSLTGLIPPELGNLPVGRLELRGNSLTGPIPPELGNLANVLELDLSANSLTGPIPPELGHLTQAYRLLLEHNSLTGPIPPELGNLAQLHTLGLHGNSLTGPIPAELGNLVQLQTLHLQDNSLSGAIPRSLMQLDNLEQFHFGGQNLCAPRDNDFQAWLSGIQNVDGPTCAGVQFLSSVADQHFPRAQPITPLILPKATGGLAPLTYSLTPTLPAGLMFDASTRTISGTPTEVTAGPVPFTYKATDANGTTDSLQFNIEVLSPVAAENKTVPESFAVHGNYPNPFRQSTRILFDLPWPARVTVEVMDVAGRRVLAVPPEDLTAGWKRDIELRGEALPSGLYLYRLMATSPGAQSTHVGGIVRLR